MPITIKIGSPNEEEQKPIQASISLQIKKTLDGNLLILDHEYLDILIVPPQGKIVALPKPGVEKDVYDYQKELMNDLFRGGVTDAAAPKGGPVFGMVETTYPIEGDVDTLQAVLYRINTFLEQTSHAEKNAHEYDENIEDRFTDPTAEDSTKYGEIPPYQDTPAGRALQGDATYTFAGYGYYY